MRSRFAIWLFAAVLVSAASTPPAAAQLSAVGSALYTEGDLFLLGPANDDEFGSVFATGDFDGDGADDLATGIPLDENLGGLYPNSGIVIVRYGVFGRGLAGGLADEVLSQAFGGSPDPAEEFDYFGYALATGDFDDDGYDDLAVGIPYEDGSHIANGAIQVYYGSPDGLRVDFVQFFDEDTPGVPGSNGDVELFGAALASGDFDADGFADLAIGVPYEGGDMFGSVDVLYGAVGGLSTVGSQRFTQDDPVTMDGSNETFDLWGFALAAADFDADGFDDLAVGAPGENDGGGVHFVFGTATGLGPARNNLWTQDDAGVFDTDEPGDEFGMALAAGDFTGDGRADLAIAVPLEDLDLPGGGEALDAGALHLFFGAPGGISSTGSWMWTESTAGLGATEAGDRWSWALAAGDFDADGFADLAVGAPREGLGALAWVGQITILRGYPDGVTGSGGQLWHQDSAGVPEDNEQGDEFARALAVGDFDGRGHADLVAGAPRESFEAFGDGAEWVFYGSLFADGFATGNASRWSLVSP